ncbi:MAG: YfhO family protein [Clostridiales bacterium]|jgi:uncharacterized membrane protein YfhO|nr:YfhO family protein [Clostridiales bacterium]
MSKKSNRKAHSKAHSQTRARQSGNPQATSAQIQAPQAPEIPMQPSPSSEISASLPQTPKKRSKKAAAEIADAAPYKAKPFYLAVSFLLPFIIFAVVFVFIGIYPFGTRQIMISDFREQYLPFLSDLWRKLREGNSMLWSWSTGGGSDYLGMISYYLASPLNLIIALFPFDALREVLTVIVLTKIGIAGLSCGFFLSKTFKRSDFSVPVFSLCYAMCGFSMGYYWNIMWLDTFAILPLVVLGVFSLVTEGKFILYVITLALSVFMNFYIGLFTCIFVVVTFFGLCVTNKLTKKDILSKLILIAVCSAIAIGLTALLTVPAYSSLQSTYSSKDVFPSKISFYNRIDKLLGNLIAFTPPGYMNDSAPNIFSGMLTVMLAALYLKSPKYPLREKLVLGGTLLFLFFSINTNVLYYIWNGFHFTNMIPFRFSFLISFMLMLMAYKAYLALERLNKYDMFFMAITSLFLLIMAASGPQEEVYVISSIILCGLYFVMFYLFMYEKRTFTKKIFKGVIAVIMIAEFGITCYIGVDTLGTRDRRTYPERAPQYASVLQLLPPDNPDFYRTESDYWFNKNESSLYGFNGISIFSSTAYESMTGFMQGIGLLRRSGGNRYGYAETSPLANAMLNIRYLVSKNGNPADDGVFWRQAGEADGALLMENKYYLPLGYMVNNEMEFYVPEGENPFVTQNDLFRRLTGLEGDLFTWFDIIHVNHKGYKVNRRELGQYRYEIEEDTTEGRLRWNYETPVNGMLYAYCKVDNSETVRIIFDGNTERSLDSTRPLIFAAGNFAEGDIVSIETPLKADDKSGNVTVYMAYINEELFKRGYEILADETMKLTKFSDTNIVGEVTALTDGLLYTSVPAEKNWTAYVDGAETEIILIDGCMAALPLKAGTHKIEFKYFNMAFAAGLAVSAVSLLSFVALIAADKKRRRNSG